MTRFTATDLQGRPGIRGVNGPIVEAAEKRSKHSNIPTIVDGFRFQSRWEARYYQDLRLQQKQGYVDWFTRQVPYWLEGNVKYVLDFLIKRTTGLQFVDTSGHLTRTKINKLRGMKDRYGILVEIKFKDGTTKTIDEVVRT